MKKFEVIKEFAGIKEGEKINVSPDREKFMVENGYVKPLKQRKADPAQTKRQNKAQPEAPQNK